jgi:hypothetical protein
MACAPIVFPTATPPPGVPPKSKKDKKRGGIVFLDRRHLVVCARQNADFKNIHTADIDDARVVGMHANRGEAPRQAGVDRFKYATGIHRRIECIEVQRVCDNLLHRA